VVGWRGWRGISNVSAVAACHSAAWTPRLGSNEGYLSTDEVDDFIDEIESTLPPYLTSIEELGASIDGRRLRALCLGRCQDGSNIPQTLYTGMHHSREVSRFALVVLQGSCFVAHSDLSTDNAMCCL